MKHPVVSALVCLLFASGFVFAQVAPIGGYYPKGGPDENVVDVSLIQLIANPQLYEDKRVRITGFVDLQYEGDAIYLHQEDFNHGLTKNGLWINLPSNITQQQIRAINDHYVICTGRFVAKNHGHMGLFSGGMTDVTRLELWGPNLGPPPPPPQPRKK